MEKNARLDSGESVFRSGDSGMWKSRNLGKKLLTLGLVGTVLLQLFQT